MNRKKIVARFMDGRVIKGATDSFSVSAPYFVLTPADGGQPIAIDMDQLKAVYFVRDFTGDPKRNDRSSFDPGHPYLGSEMEVLFKDGEKLVGSSTGYSPDMKGFFVVPVDSQSNTLEAFVVFSSIKSVSLLPHIQKAGVAGPKSPEPQPAAPKPAAEAIPIVANTQPSPETPIATGRRGVVGFFRRLLRAG